MYMYNLDQGEINGGKIEEVEGCEHNVSNKDDLEDKDIIWMNVSLMFMGVRVMVGMRILMR